MTTQSKGQTAAQLRVKQIRSDFHKELSARQYISENEVRPRIHTLDKLEKKLDKHLREIAKLVTEYSLDQSIGTDFRNDMLNDLFEEAGSRKDHAWQACFAKKYGL